MAEDWDGSAPVATTTIAPIVSQEPSDIKLFGRWSSSDIEVNDISLTVSIALEQWFKF